MTNGYKTDENAARCSIAPGTIKKKSEMQMTRGMSGGKGGEYMFKFNFFKVEPPNDFMRAAEQQCYGKMGTYMYRTFPYVLLG